MFKQENSFYAIKATDLIQFFFLLYLLDLKILIDIFNIVVSNPEILTLFK